MAKSTFFTKSKRKAILVFGGYGAGILLSIYFGFLPANQGTLVPFMSFATVILFGFLIIIHYKTGESPTDNNDKAEEKTSNAKTKKDNALKSSDTLKLYGAKIDGKKAKASPGKFVEVGEVIQKVNGVDMQQAISAMYDPRKKIVNFYRMDKAKNTHFLIKDGEIQE